MMSPQEQATARYVSYSLLGRLFREPVTADILPHISQIPHLSTLYQEDGADENRARFQQLFGFDLFPHETIFRDKSGLIGGEISGQIVRCYQQGGYQWTHTAEPDHISTQLQFLSFLCAAEADAWTDNLPHIAQQISAKQAEFLSQHLLRWLPPFVVGVQQLDKRFYGAVVDLLWLVAVDHWQNSDVTVPRRDTIYRVPTGLLDNEDTSLKMIVRYLTSPVESGVWLSGREMGEIGRQLNLPRGFGGRIQTMMNLFRSAAQYDGSAALVTALLTHVERWRKAYSVLDGVSPFVQDWDGCAERCELLLNELLRGVMSIK